MQIKIKEVIKVQLKEMQNHHKIFLFKNRLSWNNKSSLNI